ncbi:hypothetical protein AB3N59_17500 [Leptospira sp. WS92.C1]
MKRIAPLKLLVASLLIAGFVVNCFERKEKNDDLTGLIAAVALGSLQVSGSWNFYNGSRSYPGQTVPFPIDNGTVKQGEFLITNSFVSYFYSFAPADIYAGNIVEFDNNTHKLYYQITQHATPANIGKFSGLYWTLFTDGFLYVCGDLNGNKATLDEVKASTQKNDPTDMTTGCFLDPTGTPGTGFTWNRLEAR